MVKWLICKFVNWLIVINIFLDFWKYIKLYFKCNKKALIENGRT